MNTSSVEGLNAAEICTMPWHDLRICFHVGTALQSFPLTLCHFPVKDRTLLDLLRVSRMFPRNSGHTCRNCAVRVCESDMPQLGWFSTSFSYKQINGHVSAKPQNAGISVHMQECMYHERRLNMYMVLLCRHIVDVCIVWYVRIHVCSVSKHARMELRTFACKGIYLCESSLLP